MPKKYSKEQKIKIALKFAANAENLKKYPTLISMTKGLGVPYLTIKNWSDEDEEIAKIYHDARFRRAEQYLLRAEQALTDIQDFWTAETRDSKGRKYTTTRERTCAVQKAKLYLDHYRWYAAHLAPDVYGDYYQELRQLEAKIKSLEQVYAQLTAQSAQSTLIPLQPPK